MVLLPLQSHFATVKVSSVSFCTLDPKSKKLFAFINRKKKKNFCHVFQANEQDVRSWICVSVVAQFKGVIHHIAYTVAKRSKQNEIVFNQTKNSHLRLRIGPWFGKWWTHFADIIFIIIMVAYIQLSSSLSWLLYRHRRWWKQWPRPLKWPSNRQRRGGSKERYREAR